MPQHSTARFCFSWFGVEGLQNIPAHYIPAQHVSQLETAHTTGYNKGEGVPASMIGGSTAGGTAGD